MANAMNSSLTILVCYMQNKNKKSAQWKQQADGVQGKKSYNSQVLLSERERNSNPFARGPLAPSTTSSMDASGRHQ